MHVRNLLLAAVAIGVMGLSIGLMGQSGLVDGIKVTLPVAVTVGDTMLDPGEYEIRRVSSVTDQSLRIFSNDKMRYETNVLTIPVQDNKVPEDSKVVLHHIGDAYYFDKIWIEGKTYGYEFILPGDVRALQRELAETIPARYSPASSSQVTTDQKAQAEPSAAEGDSAAKAEQERLAQLDNERQAQVERDRQAELERQRQSEAIAQADRDRQAQVERDQQALAAAQAESERQAELRRETQAPLIAQAQVDKQPNQNVERLPATASNWLGFLLGGCVLMGTGVALRLRAAQSRQ
jgi:hypothetical protein